MHPASWISDVSQTVSRALLAWLLLSAQALALEYGEWMLAIEYNGTNHGFADGERLTLEGVDLPGPEEALSQRQEFEASLGGDRHVVGNVEGAVSLLLGEAGFSFEIAVLASTRCENDGGIGTCARSLTHNGEVELFFTAPEDAELRFSGTWAGSDGEGVSLVDFFSLELVRITGNPFNPQELVVINTNMGEQGIDAGAVDEIVLLEADESYQLTVRNQTEVGDGADQGSAIFTGAIVGADVPITGTVQDVSLITVVCRNLETGQSVTANTVDGTQWDCTAAGLDADAGDQVRQVAVGIVTCEADPCDVGGSIIGVEGQVTVCRNLVSSDTAGTQLVDGGWSCPVELANGDIALQIVVGEALPGAAPVLH
ncbi:MAG: hypothetical protein AAGA68_26005 [Pseudomonadota bacterium]